MQNSFAKTSIVVFHGHSQMTSNLRQTIEVSDSGLASTEKALVLCQNVESYLLVPSCCDF